MFTCGVLRYSGCSHIEYTHAQALQISQAQMKHKQTNKYKHNVLNVVFCGAQRAGCAHIESTYAACNSSYAHISRGRLSSTSSSTKQSPSNNFNQTPLLYSLHPQLPYHPHTRAIFIIIRAHEQSTNYLLEAVGAGTLVAAFRMEVISANGHLGSSPLQRRMLEYEVFVLKKKFHICFSVVD